MTSGYRETYDHGAPIRKLFGERREIAWIKAKAGEAPEST
jgi:hypothetical protein